MLSLYDKPTIDAAMAQPLDSSLRELIAKHLTQADHEGLNDLTHLVVIQPGDDEASIQAEIGFSPLVNPIDGERFGQSGFVPYWPYLADLGGWYELIQTVGTDIAFVLLIEKVEGVWPEFLEMCERFTEGIG